MTQTHLPSAEVTGQVSAVVEEPGATTDQQAQAADEGDDGSEGDKAVDEPAGEGGQAAVEEPGAAKTNLD